MIPLLFDTETTGLIQNHTIKLDTQPEIIEFYGCVADLKTGNIIREIDTFIKPKRPLSDKPNQGDKKTITQITGITNEMLKDAPSFEDVADDIARLIEESSLAIAHNVSFDVEMVDIEYERLSRKIKWPRQLCTVEATSYLKGGRLSLTKLHEYLFQEPFPDAHRAKVDVMALLRCAVELHRRDII